MFFCDFVCCFFFFFSSRRRHTRSTRDWSSDVCSSDLGFALGAADYLVKPIRKAVLLETIRKHVPEQVDDDAAILLVDDDPKALELLAETLRSAGYETQSVQSGRRALEVLSSKLVSAVL